MKTPRYGGYHPAMLSPFEDMGFGRENVVHVFNIAGIDAAGGAFYPLPEAKVDEVTERLLG
jgi:hypothetical protein